MTLGDLGKQHESDTDSDGQEHYTDGEKSGLVVQDPNKKPNRRDLEAIFERVRKSGAQEGPMAEPPQPAASRSSLFVDSSRTLSGETRQQEPVPSETGLRASPPDPVVHTVHIWRNGFTVNEGPLRRLDDPLNLPFLESINRSECPRELEPQDRNTPVNVNLVKRIDEDWQAPPEPKYVAFKGQGHTLAEEPHSQIVEESVSQIAEDSHSQIAEESVPQIAEDSRSQIAEKAVAQIADESVASIAAPIAENLHSQVAEESRSPIVDESVAPIAEEPHSQIAEESVAPIAGNPHSQVAEESHTPIADESVAQIAEETHSQVAEESHAQIGEGSLPQIGEADGSLDVLAEGLAAVLGPVVRDFDARVEGALKSQSLLTGSIDRLTKELDTLLEDTPIPMVAQHAAKLSGVRKRVASLMSTLRVIQGRIINMDRMLNTREASASNPQPRASSSPSPSPPLENSVPQSPSPPPEISASPPTSSVPENSVPGSSEIKESAS